MSVVQTLALLLVAGTGTGVVLSRDPRHQAVAFGTFGGALAVVFLVFEAPGVALSQLVVSAVVVPLMLLLTVSRVREQDLADAATGDEGEEGG